MLSWKMDVTLSDLAVFPILQDQSWPLHRLDYSNIR